VCTAVGGDVAVHDHPLLLPTTTDAAFGMLSCVEQTRSPTSRTDGRLYVCMLNLDVHWAEAMTISFTALPSSSADIRIFLPSPCSRSMHANPYVRILWEHATLALSASGDT
jgi:hypothetical protein